MKILITATLFAIAAVGTLDASEPRTITVGRKIKPMDTYLFRTQFSEEYKAYSRDAAKNVSQNVHTTVISMQAETQVQAVRDNGEEHTKLLTIRLFRVKRDSAPAVDYLYTGAIVRAEFTDKGPVFTIDKRPVADSVAMMLAQVVHAEGGTKTGAILDPSKPVRIGDTWQINTKAFLETIDENQLAIDRKKIKKASATLKAADSVGGRGMYMVSGDVVAEGVKPGGFDDLRVLNAKLMMHVSVTVPDDERYPPYESLAVLALDIPAKSLPKNGPPMEYQIRITRQQESRFER